MTLRSVANRLPPALIHPPNRPQQKERGEAAKAEEAQQDHLGFNGGRPKTGTTAIAGSSAPAVNTSLVLTFRYVLHLRDAEERVVRFSSPRRLSEGDEIELADHGRWRVIEVVPEDEATFTDAVVYCVAGDGD